MFEMFQEHPVSLVKLSFFFILVKLIQVLDFDNWHPLNKAVWVKLRLLIKGQNLTFYKTKANAPYQLGYL